MTMADKSTCGTVITFAPRSQILRKTSIFAGIASVFVALNLQPANLLISCSFSAAPSSSLSFPLTEWKRLTNYFRLWETLENVYYCFHKSCLHFTFCKISILQVVICCRIVDTVKLCAIFFVISLIKEPSRSQSLVWLRIGSQMKLIPDSNLVKKTEISLFGFINRPSQSIVIFDKICAFLQKMI